MATYRDKTVGIVMDISGPTFIIGSGGGEGGSWGYSAMWKTYRFFKGTFLSNKNMHAAAQKHSWPCSGLINRGSSHHTLVTIF